MEPILQKMADILQMTVDKVTEILHTCSNNPKFEDYLGVPLQTSLLSR